MAKTKKPFVWNEQAVVISAMRRSFRRYPPYKQVRDRCKSEYFILSKKGKKMRRVHFKCEICLARVVAKNFAVDHISPVVDPVMGFQGYATYASRLFCSLDNLQGLCKPCHKAKTTQEAKARTKARKERKK